MTRLLLKWGLAPALAQRAHKCDRFFFTNGATGAPIGFLRMGEEFMRDLAADFLFLQHQDLYDMLREHAVASGAALRFAARVVDADTAQGSVTLEGGEVLTADIVVAADGFDSALREAVTEDTDTPPDAADAHVVATFQVPMAAIRADPALAALCAPRDVRPPPPACLFTRLMAMAVVHLAWGRVHHEHERPRRRGGVHRNHHPRLRRPAHAARRRVGRGPLARGPRYRAEEL